MDFIDRAADLTVLFVAVYALSGMGWLLLDHIARRFRRRGR